MSQDQDYEGPVGYEKKFHQTHFQGSSDKPSHPKDDPNWVYAGMGRWKRIYADTRKVSEVTDDGLPSDRVVAEVVPRSRRI